MKADGKLDQNLLLDRRMEQHPSLGGPKHTSRGQHDLRKAIGRMVPEIGKLVCIHVGDASLTCCTEASAPYFGRRNTRFTRHPLTVIILPALFMTVRREPL